MNLQELRAKLANHEKKTKSKATSASYPFWNAAEGTNSVIRFLPFKGEEEGIFWTEAHQTALTFVGIEGHDEDKSVTVRVPCMTTWNEKDKIVEHIRPLWNTDKETARQYYRKVSYRFYGFVQKSPIEEITQSDIRRFNFTNSIFTKIKNGLLDEDLGLESHPCGVDDGCDFVINKSSNGQYASYDASSWGKKETKLSKEQAAIYKQGLVDRSDFELPKPDAEHQEIIYQMFLDSLNGEMYSPEKYAAYYRPFGFES